MLQKDDIQNIPEICKRKSQVPTFQKITPESAVTNIYKKKPTHEVKKYSEASVSHRNCPSFSNHQNKCTEKFTDVQVKKNTCPGIYSRRKNIDNGKIYLMPPSNEFTAQVKKLPKHKVTSSISRNVPQDKDSVRNVSLCISTECQFKNDSSPKYQLKNDRKLPVDISPPVETIDISTSPICINSNDRGTSFSTLLAENLVERVFSPVRVSYVEASTSTLPLPVMIDKQSSAHLPAGNFIDEGTNPIPSLEHISKSKSIRSSIPENIDKSTSLSGISIKLLNHEMSEECVCKNNILDSEELYKSCSVTCISRDVVDSETSPISSVVTVNKSTTAMNISIPGTEDRHISMTNIQEIHPERRISHVLTLECTCEATTHEDVRTQQNVNTVAASSSSECIECKKLAVEQALLNSNVKEDLSDELKNCEEYSSKELVSYFESVTMRRNRYDEPMQLQSADFTTHLGKKTRFHHLKDAQESDSELSDDEPRAVESASDVSIAI